MSVTYILANLGATGNADNVFPNLVIVCFVLLMAPKLVSVCIAISDVHFQLRTLRAAFMDCLSGGVGKGKLMMLSIPMFFICNTTPSIGMMLISGSENFSN